MPTKRQTEFPWRSNGSYDSKALSGLNKLRFVSEETGISCRFYGRRKGTEFYIELPKLLRNEAPHGPFTDIWEDVFSVLLKKKSEPEFLSIVAEAGATLGHGYEKWPIFSFNRDFVSPFRRYLPKSVQKEYLHYCIKEWNQHSHQESIDRVVDFARWCNAELEFLNNIT